MLDSLYKHMRPIVEFDVDNREHRRLYFNFLKDKSWGKCPFRFVVSNSFGNPKGIIDRRIIEFYLNKEFDKTV